ncbi:Hypothetical protein, putative [Bodo saltans]|nr:Hypothetical protein, putative [Bodo saltans]|eukprot:CUG90738.1 Hypothetical protein, putative [Bodo saltans]
MRVRATIALTEELQAKRETSAERTHGTAFFVPFENTKPKSMGKKPPAPDHKRGTSPSTSPSREGAPVHSNKAALLRHQVSHQRSKGSSIATRTFYETQQRHLHRQATQTDSSVVEVRHSLHLNHTIRIPPPRHIDKKSAPATRETSPEPQRPIPPTAQSRQLAAVTHQQRQRVDPVTRSDDRVGRAMTAARHLTESHTTLTTITTTTVDKQTEVARLAPKSSNVSPNLTPRALNDPTLGSIINSHRQQKSNPSSREVSPNSPTSKAEQFRRRHLFVAPLVPGATELELQNRARVDRNEIFAAIASVTSVRNAQSIMGAPAPSFPHSQKANVVHRDFVPPQPPSRPSSGEATPHLAPFERRLSADSHLAMHEVHRHVELVRQQRLDEHHRDTRIRDQRPEYSITLHNLPGNQRTSQFSNGKR